MYVCVLTSASQKFEEQVVRVVLEADGTDIDGDDELMAFSASTLLGLKAGEEWLSAVMPCDQQAVSPYVSVDVTGARDSSLSRTPEPTPSSSSMYFYEYLHTLLHNIK